MTDQKLLNYLESFLTDRRRSLNKKVLTSRTNYITVAVEDVYQLHNTSAVMRSCEVFGVQNMHVIEEVNKKKIDREIAMGAQKWVDVNRYNTTGQCIESLKGAGYQLVATTPHEGAITLDTFELTQPTALFFGTETDGLSQEVLEAADIKLKIPMVGFTESLNISVSAAIILQQLTSQLRNSSSFDWRLTPEEQLEKRMDWVKKTLKSHEQITERYYKEVRS